MKIKLIKLLELFSFLFMIGCASSIYYETPFDKYVKYLNTVNIKTVEIYFSDVINRIGEPVIKNEHENDFSATWQQTYLRTARIADEYGGTKLILYFDKKTNRLIDKETKSW